MSTNKEFNFRTVMGEITKGVLETVAERAGDSEGRRLIRHQTAAYSMMAFMPRDPLETMLAGHCVIFDHLFRDGSRDLLRGDADLIKLRTISAINGCAKSFLTHLDRLWQLQARPIDKIALDDQAEAVVQTSDGAAATAASPSEVPAPAVTQAPAMIVSAVVTAPPVMPPSRPAVLPAAGTAARPLHPPPASLDVLSGGTTTAQPRQSARTSWSATEPANRAPEARLAAALQALSERVPAAGSPRYDPGHGVPPVYALDHGRMRPMRGEAAANVATGAMANNGVANGATATGATAKAAIAKDTMGIRPMVSGAMAGGTDATADVPSPGPAVV